MTPAQLRSLGGLLLAAAIVVGVWTSDLRQSNATLAQTVDLAHGQLRRLAAGPAAPAPPPGAATAGPVGAMAAPPLGRDTAARLRRAAAGYGSDARNMAAALQRMKTWCTAAGLGECAVRRSNTLAAASAAGASAPAAAELTPYAVWLGATFEAKGVQVLLDKLAGGGFLYRVERINVVQNRTEWDVVFFHDAGLRPEAGDPPARGAKAATTGGPGAQR